MGLSLTVPQILQHLHNARLVLMALVANFVVVPAAAFVLSRVIPMEQALQIGLLLIGTAAGAPHGSIGGEAVCGSVAGSPTGPPSRPAGGPPA
jgi:BASS family bile acid:Na+ symporter